MLNANQIHHAHVHKVDFKYQLYSNVLIQMSQPCTHIGDQTVCIYISAHRRFSCILIDSSRAQRYFFPHNAIICCIIKNAQFNIISSSFNHIHCFSSPQKKTQLRTAFSSLVNHFFLSVKYCLTKPKKLSPSVWLTHCVTHTQAHQSFPQPPF